MGSHTNKVTYLAIVKVDSRSTHQHSFICERIMAFGTEKEAPWPPARYKYKMKLIKKSL